MRILRLFAGILVLAAICGALSCPRAVQAQNSAPKAANGQNVATVPGVARNVWEHLNTELDKGKDADDPGKMLRYWIRTTGGVLTDSDRQELTRLANRMASRRSLGADTELYTTMLAGLMLKFDERWQRDTLYKSEAEKKLAGLLAQNMLLAEQLNVLKAQTETHAAEAEKSNAAYQTQIKELRAQIENLRQRTLPPPTTNKPPRK